MENKINNNKSEQREDKGIPEIFEDCANAAEELFSVGEEFITSYKQRRDWEELRDKNPSLTRAKMEHFILREQM